MSFKPLVLLLAATCVVGASCSSSTKSASSNANTTTTVAPSTTVVPAVPGGPYTPTLCPAPTTGTPPIAATKVPGSTSDYDITSFDGTKIRVHWFPLPVAAGSTAPTVLKGPGWGRARRHRTPPRTGFGLFGDLSIHALHTAGYNVLTWDPRGFGKSGGTVETDSAAVRGPRRRSS